MDMEKTCTTTWDSDIDYNSSDSSHDEEQFNMVNNLMGKLIDKQDEVILEYLSHDELIYFTKNYILILSHSSLRRVDWKKSLTLFIPNFMNSLLKIIPSTSRKYYLILRTT